MFLSKKDNFIKRAAKIHGDIYDYSKVEYINSTTPVVIICPIHGEFSKIPDKHTSSNQGCPKCSKKGGRKCKYTETEFIKRSQNIWGKDRFTYIKVDSNLNNKSKFKCNICNNTFLQTGQHHLKFEGCKKCNVKKGWTKTQWLSFCKYKNKTVARLYILVSDTKNPFLKIGITSREVKDRFKEFPFNIKSFFHIEGDPETIYDLEKLLLKTLMENKKIGKDLQFGGKTECFVPDNNNLITLNLN